jgi:hypothetical protein
MTRYFDRSFLFRSTAVIGALILGGGFVAYAVLYSLLSSAAGGAGQPLFERVRLMVWFAVTLYGIIAGFLILVAGLFATHKVAGPLFRLEKATREAAGGAIPDGVHFREGDQMKPLAGAQGLMLASLASRERELAELGGGVERACQRLGAGAASLTAAEWAASVTDLRRALAGVSAAAQRRGGDQAGREREGKS